MSKKEVLSRYFTVGCYTEKEGYIPVAKTNNIWFEELYLKNQVTFLAFYKNGSITSKAKASIAPKDYSLSGELIKVFYEGSKNDEANKFIIKDSKGKYLELKYDEKSFGYTYKDVKPVEKLITAWE